MRVAYIFMRFPLPSETFAARDVNALRRHGVEVETYTLRAPHPEHAALLKQRGLEGLPLVQGTPLHAARGLAFGARHPRMAAHLLRWLLQRNKDQPLHLANGLWFLPTAFHIFGRLQANPPDVVHLFWGHYPAIVGYLVQRYLPTVPVSMFLGAYDLEQQFGGTPDVLRRADVVWTHARTNVPAIAARGALKEKDVHVVPRGIALPLIDRACRDQEHQSGLAVTTGRLIAEKGMDDVLRCLAAVRRTHPDVHLAVLGDGPQRSALEAQARSLGLAEAVTFYGHVPEARVAEMLARADVFLLLSRKPSERLPNAVKEAMAAGCVVITTATPGIEELVEDERSGYVVPLSAPAAAAARMRQVLEAPCRHEAMRRRARRVIEQRFEVEACMQHYIRRWRGLIRSER